MNLPFPKLLNEDGTMKSQAEIAELYKGIELSTEKKTVSFCVSGVTACVVLLSLNLMGLPEGKTVLYDGSW